MSLFRKNWTAAEADRWTIHDFLACLFGVLAFVTVTLGIAGSLLLQVWGYVNLGLAALFTWLTFKVINPKLRAISNAFEKKQAAYLETVERRNRWEQEDGS